MQKFNPIVVLITRTITISCLLSFVVCEDEIHATGLTCGSYQYPGEGGKMMQTLMVVMDAVSFQVKEKGWGAESLIGNWRPMYALAQCHRDLNATQCNTCFSQGRQLLSRCVPKVSGRIYLDGCFLRYDNYTFYDESVDPSHDTNVCESTEKGKPVGLFRKRVASVILNVSKTAGDNRFAVNEERGVFGLAQCWETVDKWSCQRCLREAGKKVQDCLPVVDASSLFTGCFLRYSTRKFYNGVVRANVIKAAPRESHWVWIIVACVLSGIALVLLIIALVLLRRKRKGSNIFGATPDLAYTAGFGFKYDVLENATGFFDPANKLGQGGVGSVYKGTLPSGSIVAVKRLYFNTRQWTDGLFNEVNLINGIQHKNVVKLLGCSIDGPESLLVYEYWPYKNLDQILFSKDSEDVVTWEQRFQIICGIADGLSYLHGGSGTKVVHRDIKASNILLDENFNPKIVDFGLSRSITDNKAHLSTSIAGTLGYVAPECLTRGQPTDKADIYAFGVLVIEIVCGKKNSVYTQESTSLLHCVWKDYKANNITASVDPSLHANFVVEEASNALQAGLLCTQTSVTIRPSMSEIIQMLTKKDYVIPTPKPKPFLNHTVLNLNDHSNSNLSILSNGLASARSSFHSTTSSLPFGDDLTLLDNSFTSSAKFNTRSQDTNIQVNIVAHEPK